MLKITVPIYYVKVRKRKKNKNILVGLNWYRNAHYIESNEVKSHYHYLIAEQCGKEKFDKITLHYIVYLKNRRTDGQNIRSIIEKFVLDGLVKAGVIKDDSVDYISYDSTEYHIDKNNPRVEIIISNAGGENGHN